ncbi:MAG TPA: phytoene/squalene synthase family protein [Candidatus Paceibacterota bacterium]|nr:phytoene/squalene synthase family protein [Candidatus Paceibacterota bacterium]
MRNELLTELLKGVSRSFYTTLRVLPKSIRAQIGLAYLLARTTDTIADTEIIPAEQRLRLLELLRNRILGRSTAKLDFAEAARNQGSPAERVLLEKVEAALSLLESYSAADRELIREVISTITSGQILDLQRFAGASVSNLVALRVDDELDDYTYRVAGCVGEFWTKMCVRNQFGDGSFPARSDVSEAEFEKLGICFGKGLQLVNILRDLPADLRNGRCYLPIDRLNAAGLTPADLLNPANESRFKPLYGEMLDRAEAHLRAGWEYTNLIPRREMRIRLACAWPVLIGLKTLHLLRAGNVLDSSQRIKISRREVKNLIFKSVLLYPFPAWRQLAE